MKKCIIVVLCIICVLLSACSSGGNNMALTNDERIAKKKFEEVVSAIQMQDKESLKTLFSRTITENEDTLDEDTTRIMSYFCGEVVSYTDWDCLYVEDSKENGHIFQAMESTYDIKTTEDEYRLALRFVTKDTSCPDNVGIYSLYVIRKQEDILLTYAYWGDGKFTPGINIGIQNTE